MKRVDRAYALVPSANCKGLCQESCGPIVASFAEESRILERHRAVIDFDKATLTCNQLKDGKCAIYADRPLLCRMWGVVEKMPCLFGCDAPTMPKKDERKAFELIYGKEPQ